MTRVLATEPVCVVMGAIVDSEQAALSCASTLVSPVELTTANYGQTCMSTSRCSYICATVASVLARETDSNASLIAAVCTDPESPSLLALAATDPSATLASAATTWPTCDVACGVSAKPRPIYCVDRTLVTLGQPFAVASGVTLETCVVGVASAGVAPAAAKLCVGVNCAVRRWECSLLAVARADAAAAAAYNASLLDAGYTPFAAPAADATESEIAARAVAEAAAVTTGVLAGANAATGVNDWADCAFTSVALW